MKKTTKILIGVIAALLYVAITFFVIIYEGKEYNYQIEYARCNSEKKDTVEVKASGKIYIETYREAVPVLHIGIHRKIINVCDYKILDTLK